ncbi:MAG TPA: hypothetical protein VEC13_03295 [Candidatus Paceibacterota bacterium]|nr:hypothetical protein [Candidatus Paceibacterota bacterium]
MAEHPPAPASHEPPEEELDATQKEAKRKKEERLAALYTQIIEEEAATVSGGETERLQRDVRLIQLRKEMEEERDKPLPKRKVIEHEPHHHEPKGFKGFKTRFASALRWITFGLFAFLTSTDLGAKNVGINLDPTQPASEKAEGGKKKKEDHGHGGGGHGSGGHH